MSTHTGETPPNCSSHSDTPLEGTYSRYREGTHTGEKPVICSTRDIPHHQKGNMTTCARTQRTGRKPSACPQCHKTLPGPIPPAPGRATNCSPHRELGYMVIRRCDPDDVTLQGMVTPTQDDQEEAFETPNTPSSQGRSPHTEEEPRQSAYPSPLRRRRPTEWPADTPEKDPILTTPQQERPGITDAASILEQIPNTI